MMRGEQNRETRRVLPPSARLGTALRQTSAT